MQNPNSPLCEIIEKRFAWTFRVVTGLMSLGFAPKAKDEDSNIPEGANE